MCFCLRCLQTTSLLCPLCLESWSLGSSPAMYFRPSMLQHHSLLIIVANLFWVLTVFSKVCAKFLMGIVSLNPPKAPFLSSPVKEVLLLSFYRWGDEGAERWISFSRVLTQLQTKAIRTKSMSWCTGGAWWTHGQGRSSWSRTCMQTETSPLPFPFSPTLSCLVSLANTCRGFQGEKAPKVQAEHGWVG